MFSISLLNSFQNNILKSLESDQIVVRKCLLKVLECIR